MSTLRYEKTLHDLKGCIFNKTTSSLQIFSKDGDTKVGKISKQWAGVLREMVTDADVFGINFPMDLDVKMKAVLLSACFLIVRFLTIFFLYISIKRS